MSHIFEQRFFRVKAKIGKDERQEITVNIDLDDPATHPQTRRSMALEALSKLPEAQYRSGWSSWFFGRSTVISSDYVEIVESEVASPAPHERGDAIERLKPFARFKIKNVYQDDDFPADAVLILQPDFEYPDWNEERVNRLWNR